MAGNGFWSLLLLLIDLLRYFLKSLFDSKLFYGCVRNLVKCEIRVREMGDGVYRQSVSDFTFCRGCNVMI